MAEVGRGICGGMFLWYLFGCGYAVGKGNWGLLAFCAVWCGLMLWASE